MNMNLELNYTVDDEDRAKNPAFKTNAQVSITLLRTAANATKGAPGKEGHKTRNDVRIAGQVVNAVTKAANAKATTIDLDQNQLLHVRDTLKEWMSGPGVPASLTGMYEELMTYVEKLVEEGEQKAAAKASGSIEK